MLLEMISRFNVFYQVFLAGMKNNVYICKTIERSSKIQIMKELLVDIKKELENIDIESVDFDKLTFESQIIIKADLRQLLFKLKYIKDKL
jgi:hypothetical protein